MRCCMLSDMKQKKVITIYLTRIDLQNVQDGETVTTKVKTNFETEIPYEVVVKREGQAEQDNSL